jgi:putative flippase GtrA
MTADASHLAGSAHQLARPDRGESARPGRSWTERRPGGQTPYALSQHRLRATIQRMSLVRGVIRSRLMRFLVVGGAGVVVNSAALFLFYQVARLPLVLASALAVEIALLNGYFWNNRWTFGRKDHSFIRFVQFHAVSLGGLVITTTTLWLLVRHAGVHYLAANAAGIVLATGWNFQVNRLWTWKAAGSDR